ncbi:MAG: Lrp/AsnC family transcriptional regulator [Oscillospiraceae bacterium]
MDAIDLKLITLLQKNARTPLKVLASRGFSFLPGNRGTDEKLENDGIISSYSANIDMKKAGFPIIAFIQLDLDPKLKPTFYPFVLASACANAAA